ncbi:hypothetical protein [Amycolatopsis nalaikhensis]|uniref:Uncharacterized protein n=1 Tax=Amycolatopsis nalaikhensis TaxID=715472 RepID=A0ABY8XT51_9PSEU|nr:hypothetical protein [Amycolatopsis sp. 2-2]WIV58814.1 hypothetical protein QP939_09375 [Amycolatopsis sp. 2-2]
MAEQRDDGKPGSDIEPAGSNTPAPQPPVDPAELEQFRQFQQFQDYLRFTQSQQGNQPAPPPNAGMVQAPPVQPVAQQGGQPPVIPPGYQLVPAERGRRGLPRWAKWLGRKVIAWVLAIVILGVAGTWLYNHFFPSDKGEDTSTFVEHGGGKYHTNQTLPTDPFQAVRAIYDSIGKPDAEKSKIDRVCLSMSEQAQAQFARDLGYADCATAVPALSAQVKDMNTYIYAVHNISGMPYGDTVTIHSCWFDIQGGPRLGSFALTKVEMGQWLITGHTPEPTACPPQPTTR